MSEKDPTQDLIEHIRSLRHEIADLKVMISSQNKRLDNQEKAMIEVIESNRRLTMTLEAIEDDTDVEEPLAN